MTTEQTALQRLKEVCEDATPVSWDTIPYIQISRTVLPALIEYCEKLEQLAALVEPAKEISWLEDQGWREEHVLYVSNFKKQHIAATNAVEAARARLEDVCPK